MEAYKKSHQAYVARLCGTSLIPVTDSFWLELVRYSSPLSALCAQSFQAFLQPYCEQLAKNTYTTGHFVVLATHAYDHVEAAAKASRAARNEVLNATNAIVLLRGISVQLISLIQPPHQKIRLLTSQSQESGDDVMGRLFQACLGYVETKVVETDNYALYFTILSFLLACCSSTLYHADAGDPLFAKIIEAQHKSSGEIISRLLSNVVQYPCMGPAVKLHVPSIAKESLEGTTFLATATKLASDVLMAPTRAFAGIWKSSSRMGTSPVADASLSVLLTLLYQDEVCFQGSRSNLQSKFQNLLNNNVNSGFDDLETGAAAAMSLHPSVSFSALFERIVANLKQQQSALLLYALITRCKAFRRSVVVRSDIDSLIVPLLEQLYSGISTNVRHLYILLITLLLFSEDDGFARTVFKVRLQRVSWFVERSHAELSLGDLMVSVLLKTAFRNTSAAQDEYLHSNALSTLINLAPHASQISSITAQRVCFIIEGTHKRLMWLDRKIVESVDRRVHMQERQLLQDFLRNVVHMLDILCYRALTKNSELVYSLLQQQTMLKKLAYDSMWQDGLQNALIVVQHFNVCVDTAQRVSTGAGEWGVPQVMRVIQHELLSWKQAALKPVAETHCTYEEAPHARDFFLPYLWSSILESSCGNLFPKTRMDVSMYQCNMHLS